MMRARPLQTLLAALATLIAAWPVTTLFVGHSWVPGTIGLIALVSALGMLGRYLDLPPILTLAAQLIGVLAGTVLGHLPDHLNTTLPAALNALGTDAQHTVTSYAAPAPSTVGIVFFIQLIIAIIAVTVDFLAVTARAPAIAGIPLMVAFTVSAANSGGSLNPRYFLLLGIAWLAMLYAAAERSARDWSGVRARTAGRSIPTATTTFGAVSRLAGVAALVVAVVLAGSLPSASQKFVTNGLGRGDSGSSNVGFSENLDLKKNLTDQDQTPVLTFRTTDPDPPPLRALVADDYADGHWTRATPLTALRGTDGEELQRTTDNPTPRAAGRFRLNVSENTMRTPYAVAPTQVRSADFGTTSWSYDPRTSQPSTARRTEKYTIDYFDQAPTARPTGATNADPARFTADLVTDPASKTSIDSFVRTAAPRGTPFQRAIALQSYLRDGGGFTYSLTLAATRRDSRGRPLDPISNFLATRQGYCVQFSSTMVMAARSIGIPARVGVGFLPGTLGPNGAYQVKESDAHAWPELYFEGMGWTRFEPTSASRAGAPPSYSIPIVPGSTTPAPRRSALPSRSSAPTTSSKSSTARAAAPTYSDRHALHLGWLLWTMLALLLSAAALSVLPLLALRSRRRLDRAGQTPAADRVQAQWGDLVGRMADLGIEPAPQVSPRSQEQYYRTRLTVGTQGQESLHRAVAVLERARYTDGADAEADLSGPAEDLIERIRRSRSVGTRIRAQLFPRSGRSALREMVTPWRRG